MLSTLSVYVVVNNLNLYMYIYICIYIYTHMIMYNIYLLTVLRDRYKRTVYDMYGEKGLENGDMEVIALNPFFTATFKFFSNIIVQVISTQ